MSRAIFLMQNFKVVLEYNGADFFGFQKQPGKPTIQQAFEDALSKLFNHPMKIASASGRTDTGVHAQNQIVNFKVETRLNKHQILMGLNRYLPPSVAVKKVEKVKNSFHSRFDAKSKIYEYRVWNSSVRAPLKSGRAYQCPFKLNFSEMKKGAGILKGRHDFKAFCGAGGLSPGKAGKGTVPSEGDSIKDTVRTIKRFTLDRKGDVIRFTVEADGFLHHMVRNLVGTLLEVGRGKISCASLKEIIASRDRRKAGMTAPAHALTLLTVRY